MHVSDKISYHLSDSFFKNLLAADIVSNESDPETWADIDILIDRVNPKNDYKFYSEFYLNPATKENIQSAFTNSTNYFTNMLSPGNEEQANYQENTVLDMFIYQTGRKYKKRIVGLEDAKQSMISVLKIAEEDSRPTDKNIPILIKILKGKSFNEALNTYYREKDVVMIDSLYRLSVSKRAHDLLITGRNQIMTKSIDSLAKQGSLFAAVGAAHLGGKQGIIQLLRERGYNVNPIIDVLTATGQQQKRTIEEFFPYPALRNSGTADAMIQLPLFKNQIEEKNNIGSPDFTNGGVISIKRIPLNYFLKQHTTYNPKSLDSLFFEYIAGNIIEKKYFEQPNYSGYDIKSITKTGNTQHSRFYITPLEILAVSMTGTGSYVRKYENNVFNNIKIKPFKTGWEVIKPIKGGFSVESPAFNSIYGNTADKYQDVEIQAYDSLEKSYYFLRERTLNETEQLENTLYEHKQIHYEFYLQHDMDSTVTNYDRAKNSFESTSTLENRKMNLKSFIKGNKYYLLGTVGASAQNTEHFFSSFTIIPFNYLAETKKLTDTLANFTIEIPEKLNEKLFLQINPEKNDSKNTFTPQIKHYTFNSGSGTEINLEYYKSARYESIESIDSIQSDFRKMALKKYDDNSVGLLEEGTDIVLMDSIPSTPASNQDDQRQLSQWDKMMNDKSGSYQILSESAAYDKDKNYAIDIVVSKPGSTQAIRYKMVIKNDSYYTLRTLLDKDYNGEDPFIEKTFSTLYPTATIEDTLFKDKLSAFINDAQSEKDTVRFSALNSLHQLRLTTTDFDTITAFLTGFHFKPEETQSEKLLLGKIGELKDNRVIPFLVKYYKKENTSSDIQISILKALSTQKSKAAYDKIIELLEFDLPVSDDEYDITSLFNDFENDSENSKELFPKIFEYYSIKEYNYPVIHFCNLLADQKLIKLKRINSFKKIIITNARLEYKRNLSRKEKNIDSDSRVLNHDYDDEDYDETTSADNDLINYTKLIYNLPKDKTITQLLNKIKNLEIAKLNIELTKLDIVNNRITDNEIKKSLDNPLYKFRTLNILLNQGKKDCLNNISDDDIAKSAILDLAGLQLNDTLTQLEKRIVTNNGKQVTYYFFENLKTKKNTDTQPKRLYAIAFINNNKRINPLAYKMLSSRKIDEDDINAAVFQSIINESLNEEHSRASFEKNENQNNFYYEGL